jgi:CHAT domain-containing protein
VLRSAAPDCGDLGWLRFDALPGSAREAETIVAIWKQSQAAIEPADVGAERFTGRSATEAALKQRVRGVRVLHLATHGFFLGGRCASALAQPAEAGKGDSFFKVGDAANPLLLAGFALAGANARGAPQSGEDGVLTAEEVAALDLRGVEWAVLSGCDTGVGEIRAGEGVFGLRRAFQVAGARTVIMSLWHVDDDSTRRWMTSVYEQRFVRRLGTAEAVRQASLDQLRRRRRAGTSTHPFYWAGFIAAGDWR